MPNPEPLDADDDLGFSYRASKDGKVFIAWHGKTVTTVKGREAERLLAQLTEADETDAQLIMAKATGNFKRGNERRGRQNRG
jgi:hypothetical protein